jgi:hypothetical protein
MAEKERIETRREGAFLFADFSQKHRFCRFAVDFGNEVERRIGAA